ncbi:heparinase [Altererythrobacter sp. SALINAS58]|uniref:heparinase II/III family protein n=1 Tax=Alteripontixanthobacter muriae TaxID=2705546 RepID=UPI001575468C|nr:heparinase II/III family protein [Alteripontixanthobacter muriae]NTZ43756.1 heparinase [Alteripontixanthobacter muriae]
MALPLRSANGAEDDLVVRAAAPLEESADAASARSSEPGPGEVLEPGRSLVHADFRAPSIGAADRLVRLAYRLGVPGQTLSSPFRKPSRPRLLATVDSPLAGERAAGVALRAGHFLVHGVKAPIAQIDFAPAARLTPVFERVVHGFTWLRDLASCGPREQCTATAERVLAAWMSANPKPHKGPAWQVDNTGHRLLNWLVHAPLAMGGQDSKLRGKVLAAAAETARWLDRHVTRAPDRLGEVAGWTAITAAGLLLPDGRPRRLFGEAGLIRALGELVADDGGVLSRSPMAQMEAIALLVELRACYRAVEQDPPSALEGLLALLIPPLLALVHSDGALGSWQGSGAVSHERIAGLVEASGIRTRPLKDVRQWGYQRVAAGRSVLLFDAAPPPLSRHARHGCASTLAFELSSGAHRLIVNCGGAAFAGGQVPVRIEQGLRATAAHSTLVLDDANSTAVLINGKLGGGVGEVEVDRRTLKTNQGTATKIEASHDGYAARYGLLHRRILILRDNGTELRGEDLLIPAGKPGKRGKISFALRFHVGPGVDLRLTDDKRGASLGLPDGSLWQFRAGQGSDTDDLGGDVMVEESLWVDALGRPQPVQQLVIQGLTSRGGGSFAWLLKKMG